MNETFSPMGIFGWGIFLPPPRSVKDLVTKAGGDPTNHLKMGWPVVCVAEEDHPTSMCVSALKAALTDAAIDSNQLKLVISTCQTQDYLELAVSNEVMREVNAPPECVGFDIFNGCMATLTALEVAKNWLDCNGGGYAAIVSAERIAQSIDRKDKSLEAFFWAHSDGGSALVVGTKTEKKSKLLYHGTCFYSINAMSGHLRRAFGGTRSPATTEGNHPAKRLISDTPMPVMQKHFMGGFGKVVDGFKARFNVKPDWLVAIQLSPVVVDMLSFLTRVDSKNIARTGDQFGHVGCSDLIIGIDHLSKTGQLKGNGMALTTHTSVWGAAYIELSP